MEKLETGAVQTTVISFAGDSTHSRHTLGRRLPSVDQFIGRPNSAEGAAGAYQVNPESGRGMKKTNLTSIRRSNRRHQSLP
jgi:hypothetical protein